MKPVNKAEFQKFIADYPRKLEVDICGICDPPFVTYNDFQLGKWPESVVAQTRAYDNDPNGYFYEPEENREYYIAVKP